MRTFKEVVFCIVMVTALVSACSARTDCRIRTGTIKHALMQPDGTEVCLDAVTTDKMKARTDPTYFVIHEAWDYTSRIVVNVKPSEAIRMGQILDIEGVVGTLANGERAILNPKVIGYFSKDWELLTRGGPLCKGITEPEEWPYKAELPTDPSSATAQSMSQITTLDEDPPEPDPEPNPDPFPDPVFCESIADAIAQDDGTAVELQVKSVATGGTGTFVMGEDSSSDTLLVYTSGSAEDTDRVN